MLVIPRVIVVVVIVELCCVVVVFMEKINTYGTQSSNVCVCRYQTIALCFLLPPVVLDAEGPKHDVLGKSIIWFY